MRKDIDMRTKYVGRIWRCNQCPFRVMSGIVPGPPLHYACDYEDADRTIKNPTRIPLWCPLPEEKP